MRSRALLWGCQELSELYHRLPTEEFLQSVDVMERIYLIVAVIKRLLCVLRKSCHCHLVISWVLLRLWPFLQLSASKAGRTGCPYSSVDMTNASSRPSCNKSVRTYGRVSLYWVQPRIILAACTAVDSTDRQGAVADFKIPTLIWSMGVNLLSGDLRLGFF